MSADILTLLTTYLGEKDMLYYTSSMFGAMQRNEERINFVLEILSDCGIQLPEVGKEKDAIYAKNMRQKGNMVFISRPATSKKYMEALELYNKSIASTPCNSIDLSLAYGNRSAVLFEMGKYAECIEDIDRALALEDTEGLSAKLHVRKVGCLAMLNDPTVDKVCNQVQELLEKMSLNDSYKRKLKTKVQTNSKIKNINNVRNTQENSFIDLGARNPEASCASDALTIKYTKMLGRHIVANRTILPGEPVVKEKPYSAILMIEQMHTHCANCLRPHWTLIPCGKCSHAMYCSEKCRDVHWGVYHDIECSVFACLLESECYMVDLFSLRLAVHAVREFKNIEELREEVFQVHRWPTTEDPRTVGFFSDGKLYSDKFRSVYGLVTNVDKRSVSSLFRRALDACRSLYFVVNKTNFFGTKMKADFKDLQKNQDMLLFGSLILQYQMVIPTNAHDIYETYGTVHTSFGAAALPFCSLFNHSCAPNVTRLTDRDLNVVVYATEPIKEGEQVFDNYGHHYSLETMESRHKNLIGQYFFKCRCVACMENWPLYFSQKSYMETVSSDIDKSVIHFALRKFSDIAFLSKMLDAVENKADIAKDLILMIKVLHSRAVMPCAEMSQVVETLKWVYDYMYSYVFRIPKVK